MRKKILALAADEVRAWAAQPESVAPQRAPRSSRPGSKAKSPQPTFEDVQLHAFDLSNSNEPVLVLTAKARMPARPNAASDLQYIITLVARDDIYGDLHKAFASVTDTAAFRRFVSPGTDRRGGCRWRRARRAALSPGV